ncbi:SRPBCC family protein [Arthrobacter castelli]|uniref:SRPBCC family protein n=1 Tax=Arthrobacter castelli TaxID=271431 RepID=UPI00041B377B|nr:SRPBCC domain-containing protein [Arthrobacter castelli]
MDSVKTLDTVVTKQLKSAPEKVFDAWIDPGLVPHWFSPGLGEMVRVETDPRVGGIFRFDQQRREGLARHWGTYLAVERPHRLSFTWCVDEHIEPDTVTIDIAPAASGSIVTITHQMSAEFSGYAEQTASGWGTMLEGVRSIVE